ncbi:zinc finger protein 726-like [Cydia strobilella]|uniref:zinc finger protein 726-like n=1 Tax=Cydia strobilella TaxID=1100964 RepID=UPI0030073A46
MSQEGAKYVWVELEPVWEGAAGLHTKQEHELKENVKTEVKSEPEENMCVISETAGAGLYLKHEQPESAQAHLNHAVEPEVKTEPKDMSGSEPAACLYSHIDPEVKAALKAEDENVCGDSGATIQTSFEYESAHTSQVSHLVMANIESESESVCSTSTLAEQALYLKHEVKDGLVVGPEVYHRESFDLAIVNPVPERSCTVRLERMHLDMEHCVCRIGDYTYKFQLCSQQENDTTDERYSQRSADDVDEELYKCESCSFTSVHKHYLRVHKNIAHANEKMCKQRKNSEKKPYQCDQCSYASNRKIGLAIHKRVHRGEKAYRCNQCDYGHARKYELEVHINTVHGSEKVYKCDQCKFATVREDIFQSHKKMHTKNIPYKCDQCDFATNVKDYLQVHRKTHTVEKPYKCDECAYDSASETLLGIHKTMMHGAFAQRLGNGKMRKTKRKSRRKHTYDA